VNSRRMRTIGGAIPGILLAGVLTAAVARSGVERSVIGTTPSIRLVDARSGHALDDEDLAGSAVVMTFTASWCVPCELEAPVLVQAHSRYPSIRFLDVAYHDDGADALAFARRVGFNWSVADDPGSATALELGVAGVPETFVLDASGRVTGHIVGPVTAQSLAQLLSSGSQGSS
jgi:cytochrome c biogenesis protein CcmG, thiol:disulfide interchange protein DsbE